MNKQSQYYTRTSYGWTVQVHLKNHTYLWVDSSGEASYKPDLLWIASSRREARGMARELWKEFAGDILSAKPIRVSVITKTLP